jgi:hypothetical protein
MFKGKNMAKIDYKNDHAMVEMIRRSLDEEIHKAVMLAADEAAEKARQEVIDRIGIISTRITHELNIVMKRDEIYIKFDLKNIKDFQVKK